MNQTKNVFQFKVTLSGSKPLIWRRIFVPDNYSFFDLHSAIQDAFGWEDAHLHQFFMNSPFKRDQNYKRIAFPDAEMDDVIDERKEILVDWFYDSKNEMWYEYDFGDSWMHVIKLEKILSAQQDAEYPVLLDGANACPPEDCGGLGGYYDLLEKLADPKHPEHIEMLEWLGLDEPLDFNPKEFDKESVEFRDPKEVLKEYEEQLGI